MPSPIEVIHLKCNDNLATTNVVNDGSGADMTLNGGDNTADLSQVSGKINRSLLLTATADYIDGGDQLDSASTMTIMGWFKTSANGMLFSKCGSANNYWYVYIVGGKLNFRVNGTINFVDITGTTTVTDGAWHHVVCIRNGDAVEIRLDGASEKTGSGTSIGAINNAYAFRTHSWVFTSTLRLTAEIDDVRGFAENLTPTQSNLIYNGGNGTELTLAELEAGGSTKGGLCLLGVGL